MAFYCGFFNSVNGDRKYNAEQMNNPYSLIVSNGIIADTKGSTAFKVVNNGGLELLVKKGSGIFAGKWGILDSDMSFTIPTPHVTYTRIDSIIIRIDTSQDVRKGTIEYIQGEPSSSPVIPAITRSSTVTEYRLANITVGANISIIATANIADTRSGSECGIVSNLLQDSDVSSMFSQWEGQFNQFYSNETKKYEDWSEEQKNSYNSFAENSQNEYEDWTNEKKDDYTSFTNQKESEYEEWFENVKNTLSKQTLITSYFSNYTTTEENETEIPINISALNSVLDCVQVHINGLLLIPEVDYTMNNFETVSLTKPVDVGTSISFSVLKSIDGSEAETVIKQVQDVFIEIDKINTSINDLKKQDSAILKKLLALETNSNTVGYDLDVIPNSLVPSGAIIVEESNTLYKMSLSQLKSETSKIPNIPISTEYNKIVGDIWLENEIVSIEKIIYSFSQIGLISTSKKNQVACIYGKLYVLNENGKLFKIDLENKTCVSMYANKTFNYILVNENLIVFIGNDNSSTVAINYETNVEYSMNTTVVENIVIKDITNYSYPLNKYNRVIVHNGNYLILAKFVVLNNELILSPDDSQENYRINYTEDFCLKLMYTKDFSVLGFIFTTVSAEDNFFDFAELNITSVSDYVVYLTQISESEIYYNGMFRANNSKTKFYELFISTIDGVETKNERDFYSDDKILSEIISLRFYANGFFALQKTVEGNRFAIVRYAYTTSGIQPEVVSIVEETNTYTEIDFISDLENERLYYNGNISTPEFICLGNKNNFIGEKVTPEYNTKLKIKLPNGIKNIGLSE